MISIINIVDIAEIEISMNDSKMLRIIDDGYIICMKFGVCKDRAMHLIPILYSFGYIWVIFLKHSAKFMQLCEISSPGKDDCLIFHPSELHEF